MIKAIVFDLDGVIISSKVAEYESWKRIFKMYDCNLSIKRWITIIDNPTGSFDPATILYKECKYNSKINLDEVNEMRKNLYNSLKNHLSPFPGIPSLIRECHKRGLLIGLASNGRHEDVKFHLTRLKILQIFKSIKCRDDVENKKPAPDVYIEVLKDLGVDSSEAIVIEDSPPGITAAKAAGVYCVAVPNLITKYLDLSGADRIVSSVKKIQLDEFVKC